MSYQDMIKQMFREDKGQVKVQDNIQKADFMDDSVKRKLRAIKTGEDAISFFAKYGNTTPIKFIHCIRAPTPKEIFKPYFLKILPRQEREPNLTQYYTISASGIVHVHTLGRQKSLQKTGLNSLKPTDFQSLAMWMRESTLFNVISNINFFKNYIILKIFLKWRKNVRYKLFCKTRQRLIQKYLAVKPQYAEHIRDINKHCYDLSQKITIHIRP